MLTSKSVFCANLVKLFITILRFKKSSDNPYVVKLLDDFKFTGPGDLPFHAMIFEYLSGGDLHKFIETKRENGMLFVELRIASLKIRRWRGRRAMDAKRCSWTVCSASFRFRFFIGIWINCNDIFFRLHSRPRYHSPRHKTGEYSSFRRSQSGKFLTLTANFQ